jgi:hypothetical protein
MCARNYSPRSKLQRMRRFCMDCRQLLPWDYFRIARDSGAIPRSDAGRFGMVPSTASRLMERLISHKPTSGSLLE